MHRYRIIIDTYTDNMTSKLVSFVQKAQITCERRSSFIKNFPRRITIATTVDVVVRNTSETLCAPKPSEKPKDHILLSNKRSSAATDTRLPMSVYVGTKCRENRVRFGHDRFPCDQCGRRSRHVHCPRTSCTTRRRETTVATRRRSFSGTYASRLITLRAVRESTRFIARPALKFPRTSRTTTRCKRLVRSVRPTVARLHTARAHVDYSRPRDAKRRVGRTRLSRRARPKKHFPVPTVTKC